MGSLSEFLVLVISGLSIGIIGGFHCVGMCGPLALSLPIHNLTGFNRGNAILLYNLGRALTYTVLGVIFGLLGKSFALFKLQQWLSILSGVLILLVLFGSKYSNHLSKPWSGFANKLKDKLSTYLRSEKKTGSYFYIGLLNGLLPCGLVYVAIAASFATGGVWQGALLMFAFGLGTLPAMAGTMVFGKFISFNVRQRFNQVTPFLVLGVSLLLILRGLNLGIPYLSPSHDQGHVKCCEK